MSCIPGCLRNEPTTQAYKIQEAEFTFPIRHDVTGNKGMCAFLIIFHHHHFMLYTMKVVLILSDFVSPPSSALRNALQLCACLYRYVFACLCDLVTSLPSSFSFSLDFDRKHSQ